MSAASSHALTQLLARARAGDREAASEVFCRLNGELRAIAERLFAGEHPGSTLQPTVLVNEAWMKMQEGEGGLKVPDVLSRGQFCAVAARVMREILVEHARAKRAVKRGGGQVKISMAGRDVPAPSADTDVLALHEAVERLHALRPRAAQVVELRYFGGSTIPETAVVLGVSPETVKNDWRFARAWLRRELGSDGE
jgi:RNA polymerase sigma factor (TIGR02999 family)